MLSRRKILSYLELCLLFRSEFVPLLWLKLHVGFHDHVWARFSIEDLVNTQCACRSN
jgi:hypothetical protein